MQHSISADPNVQPAVDPHYFEEAIGNTVTPSSLLGVLISNESQDLEAFTEVIKFIRKMPEVSVTIY
jgi:hypothetical protein